MPDAIVMDSFVESGILCESVEISQTNQVSYKQHLQAQLDNIL